MKYHWSYFLLKFKHLISMLLWLFRANLIPRTPAPNLKPRTPAPHNLQHKHYKTVSIIIIHFFQSLSATSSICFFKSLSNSLVLSQNPSLLLPNEFGPAAVGVSLQKKKIYFPCYSINNLFCLKENKTRSTSSSTYNLNIPS